MLGVSIAALISGPGHHLPTSRSAIIDNMDKLAALLRQISVT
jgi:hypothetical protein